MPNKKTTAYLKEIRTATIKMEVAKDPLRKLGFFNKRLHLQACVATEELLQLQQKQATQRAVVTQRFESLRQEMNASSKTIMVYKKPINDYLLVDAVTELKVAARLRHLTEHLQEESEWQALRKLQSSLTTPLTAHLSWLMDQEPNVLTWQGITGYLNTLDLASFTQDSVDFLNFVEDCRLMAKEVQPNLLAYASQLPTVSAAIKTFIGKLHIFNEQYRFAFLEQFSTYPALSPVTEKVAIQEDSGKFAPLPSSNSSLPSTASFTWELASMQGSNTFDLHASPELTASCAPPIALGKNSAFQVRVKN